MRRVSGIWPPSNCGLPPPGPWCPVRALIPLCPLPDVLPVPEPGPRPRRFRSRCDAGAGARLSSPNFAIVSATISLLHGSHLDEVTHLLELPTQRRRVRLDHFLLVVTQT